jgi:hypothetical protein
VRSGRRLGARGDHRSRSLIDRSPDGFILTANVVLYSTVLAETGMLMIAVMALIVAIAGSLCAFIMRLMGSETYILGEAEKPEARPPVVSLAGFGRASGNVAGS